MSGSPRSEAATAVGADRPQLQQLYFRVQKVRLDFIACAMALRGLPEARRSRQLMRIMLAYLRLRRLNDRVDAALSAIPGQERSTA